MSNNLGVTSSLIVGDQLTVTFGVTGLTAVEDASIWFSFDGSSLDSASISFIASYGFEAHTFDLIAGSASIAVTYNVDPLPGSDLFSVVFDFAAGTNPASFQIDDVLGNNTGDGYTTPVDVVLYPTSFNTLPTGGVSFSGTLTQNETLSAANTIVDFDGFSSADYQWQRSSNGVDGWADISGATASDYTLQQSEVGYYIRVVASYEDGQGNTETFYSDVSGATIANVNDAPVASADSLSATEDTNDTFLASELLSNDSDLDGDALVISSVTSGIGGTVTLNGGNVDFSPTLNFNGEASFTYVASDQNGGVSDPTTVTIDVSPVDDPATGGVSISGTQRQGQTLTAISTLADNDGIQSLSFQWKADGVDLDGETDSTLLLSQQHVGKTISVVATLLDNDGTETSDSDTAASAVANLNDAPAGTDNTISLNEDGTHTLLASDFGFSDLVDGTDSLAAVKITSLPGAGELRYNGVAITAQQVADGYEVSAADLGSSLLVFVPAADASGVGYASFNFQVRDDGGTANGGVDLDPSANTITFDVTAINDAPVLDAAESPELNSLVEDVADVINTGTTIAALVVDGSVTDADGAALESAYVSAVDNANGSWQFSTDGSSWNAFDFSGANSGKGLLLAADDLVRFVPNADWNGSATLTFGAWDQVMGAAGAYADISTTGGTTAFSSETDTASITVTAVVDIADDSGSTTEDTAKDLSVFVNDSFDGTPSITSVTDGAHGTVSIIDAGAGTVRYTPDANYHGGDSFTYTVTSGGVTEVATVTVTVNQDNDAAVFGGATSGSGNEDNQLSGTLTATDTIDGMTTPNFRIESGDEASNGTAAINSETGAWTYDPSANFNGSDSFIVSVTDDDGNVETRQVDLTLAAVNDDPANSVPGAQTVDEDDFLVFNTVSSNLISVSDNADVAAGGTDNLTTVLSVINGVVTVSSGSGATVSENGSASVTVSGTTTQINAALAGLVYAPSANFNGDDTLTINTSDSGNTGSGGVLFDEDAITITVNSVNDDPGGTVLINGDGSQLFRGNELSADTSGVTDVDGLGAFSYLWFSDASPIVDATSSSFTLTEAEEGTTVSVRVSYLDDDGTSETVAGELVIPATMSFAGIVYHWQNRVLLEGVTISATPDGSADTYDASTPASGDYLLDPLPVADQSVDVSRATDDMGTAISASDATALLKILVGKNPNGDGEGAPPLSPFQVLAADVDRDGTLGINDAIGILKMAVNASDAPADEWLFVEESRDLWDEGSNSSILGSGTNGALWNPGITYPSDGASDLNFVAVLKGDVNSSWGVFPNLPAGSEVLPEDYFADNAAFLGVPLDLWSI